MDTLPADLLSNVLSHTTVADVLHTKRGAEASGNRVLSRECDHRLSVKTYLGKSFRDPVKLLESMSDSSVILSGSRAAEFFVPGSAVAGSDWDFYADGSVRRTSTFIEKSKDAGIEWLEPIDKLREIISKGSGLVVVAGSAWREMEKSEALEAMVSGGLTVENTTRERTPRIVLEATSSKELMVRELSKRDVYPDIQCIIYGKTTHGGVTSDVQLIITGNSENLLCSFLFDFHLSCVQSYISGHTASHLYGRSACAMKTYVWDDNAVVGKGMESVEKYKRRGYEIMDLPLEERGFDLRASNDNKAITLPSYNFTGASEGVVKDYKMFSSMLMWAERKQKALRFIIPTMRPFRMHDYRDLLHTRQQAQQNKVLKDWGLGVGTALSDAVMVFNDAE